MQILIFIVCFVLLLGAVKFWKSSPRTQTLPVENISPPSDAELEKRQKALKDQQQRILDQQRETQQQRLDTYNDPNQTQQGM